MRELYKDVEMELDGKKYLFKIKKMDALSTNNILKLLTEKLLPVATSRPKNRLSASTSSAMPMA